MNPFTSTLTRTSHPALCQRFQNLDLEGFFLCFQSNQQFGTKGLKTFGMYLMTASFHSHRTLVIEWETS